MAALLAFLITALELGVVAGGYLLESHSLLYNALVYGSPFYLLMNLLGGESALTSGNPLYLGLLAFHVVKYIIIFRAQLSGERPALRWLAILFEAAYLVLSSYYIN
jgi:hypothetical protein